MEADLCVIGAGAAGLSVAAGATQLGARTILVESGAMGGECLNSGCVPSKALLAAAKLAEAARQAQRFGIAAAPRIDFAAVMRHVRGVIDAIAPNDSEERFTGLGVTVLRERARFLDGATLAAGAHRIRARRFVVATGSEPAIPPIPGLAETPFLTNETLFGNSVLPRHLVVIGAGPIGIEMAQAHRLLGADVTVLEQGKILPKDDPELVDVLRRRLGGQGIAILEGAEVRRCAAAPDGVAVEMMAGGTTRRIEASHLLLAAGRTPRLAGLELGKAGVEASAAGIRVDARLRTTNRKIFAVGDVIAGAPHFTHAASYQAGIVIKNALFRWPAKASYRALPWVTYTDPELAQVGLGEAAALERHGKDVNVLRWPFHENDRAQAERAAHGLVKVVTRRNGVVLGASILGANAGELIYPWILAVERRFRIGALATMIAPYPTFGEAGKRAAGSFYAPRIFGPRVRGLVRLLARLG